MKVALAICPQVYPDRPPISLAYLAAYLRQENIQVYCFDFNIYLYSCVDEKKKKLWDPASDVEWLDEQRYNSLKLVDNLVIDRWIKEIETVSPKIIGFSLLSTNTRPTLAVAKEIKKRDKNIKIIFGGPEVYRVYLSKNYNFLEYADALILGEGEDAFAKLCKTYMRKGVIKPDKRVIVKDVLNLDEKELLSSIPNLDEIPFPDYGDFSLQKYKEKGQFSLIFSRGCIGSCAFCFERSLWGKYRCRSVKNIIDEINEIKTRYGIWCFALNDSLFNGDMDLLSEFCDRAISENLEINWWGMARIRGQMTKQFLQKMKKAGCQQISYGVESGSQKVLNLMNKGYTIETIDEVIFNTYMAGIEQGINLLLGFPKEEEDDFQQTCEFIRRNGKFISFVNISTLGIEPGTTIYNDKEKFNISFSNSIGWQTYDGTNNYQIRLARAERLSEFVSRYVKKVIKF